MLTTSPQTQAPAWAKAIAQPAPEFAPTALPVLAGSIPNGLRGSLYQIGPGRLERGGQRVGHWFDGDGAVLGVHFTNAGATGVYRYVQTEEYHAETAADKLIFGSYGRTPSGPIWKQLTLPMKNCANTGVLSLGNDRLLALWEAGLPHALDPQTLETQGIDDLQALEADAPFGAHPKQDPASGDIYNFGVTYGRKGSLRLYRLSAAGTLLQQATIALAGLPLIHDFVLAGDYLVFFIPPVRLNAIPFLARRKSFSAALAWQPQKGTQILVINRHTFEVVSRGQTDPWFQWRFGNGCVAADGTLSVEVLRYDNFPSINQFLQEVATGNPQTAAKGTLWHVRLDPRTGEVLQMQTCIERGCEFPTVSPACVGRPWRYTYLCLHRPDADISRELFGALARYDYESGVLSEVECGEGGYPASPVYAIDADNPEQGWILTVVFDSDRNTSEVWIFDALRWRREPVCQLALPSVVPPSFHGTWQPA